MGDYEAAREAMVEGQIRPADVTRRDIQAAMLTVPRERFVPAELRPIAYADAQPRLGAGRVLLDPRTFAKMLDAAEPKPDDLVLDVGCGYGYSSMVIAQVAAAVIALEENADLADRAAALFAELGADTVALERGPLADGAPDAGPFDVIMVEGAIETPPARLLDQLKDGGRLVAVWADGPAGHARLYRRAGSVVSHRRVFDALAPVLPGFDAPKGFSF
ncbi:MAG: protein-L-isoaspartate O-methyltransferase [Rhodobacteraceae bacterium]|nr:MAG: protein-L-isoaspartate O-methyltransferase [Paracoccaceae bacterium]